MEGSNVIHTPGQHSAQFSPADSERDSRTRLLSASVIPAPCEGETRVELSPEQIARRKECLIRFLQQTAYAVGASTALGLSIMATVISGGAGVPVTALTAVAAAIAIGDACCAYYNYMQERQQKPVLKTGCDSIAFAISNLAECCGAGTCCADNLGDATSFLLRVGTGVSTIILPHVMALHVPGTVEALMGTAAMVTSASVTLVGAVLDSSAARIQRRMQDLVEEERAEQQEVQEQENVQAFLRKRRHSAPAILTNAS